MSVALALIHVLMENGPMAAANTHAASAFWGYALLFAHVIHVCCKLACAISTFIVVQGWLLRGEGLQHLEVQYIYQIKFGHKR